MSRTQELRRHLTTEHDEPQVGLAVLSLDQLHQLHGRQHDHRGSIYHTSHKAVESPQNVSASFYCADYLHGGKKEPAAWYVQYVDVKTHEPLSRFSARSAAVCDEHLADGVRFVVLTAEHDATEGTLVVRRENVSTTTIAASAL